MNPLENHILGALPPSDFRRLESSLEFVDLKADQMLSQYDDRERQYVYFPVTAIISFVWKIRPGELNELALVGAEGLVGLTHFMGGASEKHDYVVRKSGYGYRANASVMQKEYACNSAFFKAVLRFNNAFLTQVGQTGVCNRFHDDDQQVCKWLLLCLNRIEGARVNVSDVVVDDMLGVPRSRVREVVRHLENLNVVTVTEDGGITALDRERLQQCTCECYRIIEGEYERLLLPLAVH